MLSIISALILGLAFAEGVKAPSVLHFYQLYSYPVDAQQASFSGDGDITVALGHTLVTYNRFGQMDAALAHKWTVDPSNRFIDFELRPDLKWSDGKPLTPHDVILSFAQLKLRYGSRYVALFESYQSIEVRGQQTVRFNLSKNIEPQKFLDQIVMPYISIFRTGAGRPDFSVSSGAYSLYSSSKTELILKVNRNYVEYEPSMFDEIHIRHSNGRFISAGILKTDPWPDMVYVPSTISVAEIKQLPAEASFWRRPDRLMALSILNRRNLPGTRALLRFARANSPLQKIADSVYDGRYAKQMYPPAVRLHSPKDPVSQPMTAAQLGKLWTKDSVEIVYDSIRIHPDLLASVRKNLCDSIPVKCRFIAIPGANVKTVRDEQKYDLMLSGVFVDPVEVINPVSYFFEPTSAVISSDNTEKGNFRARVKRLRDTGQGNLDAYRALFFDAVEDGFILPLVHHSSIVVGRKNIDFSKGETAIGNPDFEDIRRRP